MSISFNADEIFEMAETIERNAAGFYRQAAANAAAKNIEKMLLDLAAMEDSHRWTFQQMREALTVEEKTSDIFDPDNNLVLYLQTMAGQHGFEGRINATETLTGRETIEQILKIAVNSEKNSIVFYVGLKSMVPPRLGQDKVEAIIKEEMSHLGILSKHLAAL